LPAKRKRRRDGISFRQWDQCWYTSVGGCKEALRDETGEKIRGRENEAQAKTAFYRRSLEIAQPARANAVTFAELARDYLLYLKTSASRSAFEIAKQTCESFATHIGIDMLAEDLTPAHVHAWLLKHPGWSVSTHATYVPYLKAALGYAIKQTRRLSQSPLATLKTPTTSIRTAIFTQEQLKIFFDSAEPAFRQFCWFIERTGCRPGEAAKLEVRHFHDVSPHAEFILAPGEHKNGRKSNNPRHIFLSGKTAAAIRELVQERRTGYVFLNSLKHRWTVRHADSRLAKYRKQLKLPDELKLHSLRHTFATRHIDNGVPIERVATWLGDTVQTVQRVYWHAIHRANRNLFKGLD
jgi:integrase